MKLPSKSERIRQYLQHGIFTIPEISEITGVAINRIHIIRWRMRFRSPDGRTYGAVKMAKYRAESRREA